MSIVLFPVSGRQSQDYRVNRVSQRKISENSRLQRSNSWFLAIFSAFRAFLLRSKNWKKFETWKFQKIGNNCLDPSLLFPLHIHFSLHSSNIATLRGSEGSSIFFFLLSPTGFHLFCSPVLSCLIRSVRLHVKYKVCSAEHGVLKITESVSVLYCYLNSFCGNSKFHLQKCPDFCE